jgi:hypothetical protein
MGRSIASASFPVKGVDDIRRCCDAEGISGRLYCYEIEKRDQQPRHILFWVNKFQTIRLPGVEPCVDHLRSIRLALFQLDHGVVCRL